MDANTLTAEQHSRGLAGTEEFRCRTGLDDPVPTLPVTLERLDIKPGDILAVEFPMPLSFEAEARIVAQVRAALAEAGRSEVAVLVLSDGGDIKAIRVPEGGFLAVTYPRPLSVEQQKRLAATVREGLADRGIDAPVVVLEEGADLEARCPSSAPGRHEGRVSQASRGRGR